MAALTAYRVRSNPNNSSDMLTIRLSRVGKKKQPSYRLIVSEKARDPWGKATEILGSYDPRTKKAVLVAERIAYWRSKGATVSDSVWNLLLKEKLVEGTSRNVVAKLKSNPPKKEDPKAEAAPAETKPEEKKEEAPAAPAA